LGSSDAWRSSNFSPPTSTSSARIAPCSPSHAFCCLDGRAVALLVALRERPPLPARASRLRPRARKRASTFQYSSGTNAPDLALALDDQRTATDCTRPALSPRATFFHSSGETW
jgi:hypothetical protein